MIGLITDLQRAESLSLEKFLHLPVSLAGVFLINYVSSLFSLNLILFVPAMLGFSVGLVISPGAGILLVQFPLVAAFLLVVTALTYQFQGWLAALMVNPRRRRTVIVLATMTLILVCQVPNLLNIFRPWQHQQVGPFSQDLVKNSAGSIARELFTKSPPPRTETARTTTACARLEAQERERRTEHIEQTVRLINLCLPPGWLPLGAGAGRGRRLGRRFWHAGTGADRLSQSVASLSHHAALLHGSLHGRQESQGPETQSRVARARAGIPFIERRLPWLSEPATAMTLASFRLAAAAAGGQNDAHEADPHGGHLRFHAVVHGRQPAGRAAAIVPAPPWPSCSSAWSPCRQPVWL